MKKNLFFVLSLMLGLISVSFAQNTGNNDRYNLAVYATGLQNDQPLSNSLLTVVQNKTITKLTGEGNYRLIERSNEFLRQIQNEQATQQSGDVADDQIVEIGKGYGAEKICVVSITIIDKYLYIATRIVDVATKTSYESGDAEVKNYKSNDIPLLTQTLVTALNNMMAASSKKGTLPVTSTKPVEPSNPAKVSDNTSSQREETPKPIEPVSSSPPHQAPDHFSTSQNGNHTETETKVAAEKSKEEAKTEKINSDADFKAYEKWVKEEKRGGFLGVNSLAYKEYRKWRGNIISGSILFSLGVPMTAIGWSFCFSLTSHKGRIGAYALSIPSTLMMTTGIIQLCIANKHLKKSYQYYLNGSQQTATLQFHPYYGENNTFGAGLTLRF